MSRAAAQPSLFPAAGGLPRRARALLEELAGFQEFGRPSARTTTPVSGERPVPTFVNEFWTARQRAGHPLHEVSYRACFKPQLPAFFVERLTRPGQRVYDPFAGRGTTPLEAALRGRVPWSNDVNPLSAVLLRPRLEPPRQEEVAARLAELDLSRAEEPDPALGLDAFYHPDTLRELCALRALLLRREAEGALDPVDRWIRMVAVNRLTGHSPGFFSVYTLPPNQAVSAAAQRAINARRGQVPPRRPVAERIARKSRALLQALDAETRAALARVSGEARLLQRPAHATDALPEASVELVVTSPPFLDVVDYAQDNWLRCWFCGIDPAGVALTVPAGLAEWSAAMTAVMREQARLLRPGGVLAFEVGEVRGGSIRLEEAALPCGVAAGLRPLLVLINQQAFTKTANCWGVDNQRKGTNTNRVCLFLKP